MCHLHHITSQQPLTQLKIKYKKCCLALLCLLHIHTLYKSTHTHTGKEPVRQTQHDIKEAILTSSKYHFVLVVIILASISPSGQRTHFFCFCLCCSHAEGLNPFPSLPLPELHSSLMWDRQRVPAVPAEERCGLST